MYNYISSQRATQPKVKILILMEWYSGIELTGLRYFHVHSLHCCDFLVDFLPVQADEITSSCSLKN